jgi:hypothetical protein
MTPNESEQLYKKQMSELNQLFADSEINSEEYFDTKLALSQLALSNGIPRDRVSGSIRKAIDTRTRDDPNRYTDPDSGKKFRIEPNRILFYPNSIGPIYRRIYL